MRGLRASRAKAFEKLADLSVKHPFHGTHDFGRLCDAFTPAAPATNGHAKGAANGAQKTVAAVPMVRCFSSI